MDTKIHATNEDNTLTFCGLSVDGTISYHRGGIMMGMIIDADKHACKECINKSKRNKNEFNRRTVQPNAGQGKV